MPQCELKWEIPNIYCNKSRKEDCSVMMQYGVILFHTSSSVMRAEKLVLKAGYIIKLIPTPREFSSDCGIALRFDWAQLQQIKAVLNSAHIDTAGIHQMKT